MAVMATANCIFHMLYFILHHIMFVAPFKAFYHVKTPYPQTKIGTYRADIADKKEIYETVFKYCLVSWKWEGGKKEKNCGVILFF